MLRFVQAGQILPLPTRAVLQPAHQIFRLILPHRRPLHQLNLATTMAGMHHKPVPGLLVQPHIPPRCPTVLTVPPPAHQHHQPIIEHTYDLHKHVDVDTQGVAMPTPAPAVAAPPAAASSNALHTKGEPVP